MAEITIERLHKALEDEGVELDASALRRAFRRIATPEGCEHCGQHVKVGHVVKGNLVTTCCGQFIQEVPKETPPPKRRGSK